MQPKHSQRPRPRTASSLPLPTLHPPRRVRYLSAMVVIFRGYVSGNGIRHASLVGEIAPDPTDASCFLGRFAWSGEGIAEGERFLLALPDCRQYQVEVERIVNSSPRVVWFRSTG